MATYKNPREWRLNCKLSLAKVAAIAGIRGKNPARTYQRWEAGVLQPPPGAILAIQEASGGAVSLESWCRLQEASSNAPDTPGPGDKADHASVEHAKGGTGSLLVLAKELGVELTPADFLPVNAPNTASSDNTADRADGSSSRPIFETEKSHWCGGSASQSASLGGDLSSTKLQSRSAPVGAGEST